MTVLYFYRAYQLLIFLVSRLAEPAAARPQAAAPASEQPSAPLDLHDLAAVFDAIKGISSGQ